MIQIHGWSAYPWLRHGFSERRGGFSTAYTVAANEVAAKDVEPSLNLGFTAEDDPTHVRKNRAWAVRELAGDSPVRLVTARQIHGTHLAILGGRETGLESEGGRATLEADGLLTAAPGLLLGIQVADCVPVLVADTRLRAVAAFHAGWRGTAASIVEKGVACMRAEYGSAPEDLIAAIGPSIGGCCYAVGDEVQTRFRDAFPYARHLFQQHAQATHLDLAEANRRQLVGAGLGPDSISLTGQCTACTVLGGRRRYFSHRAEHGVTGRAMGLIGIVDNA